MEWEKQCWNRRCSIVRIFTKGYVEDDPGAPSPGLVCSAQVREMS